MYKLKNVFESFPNLYNRFHFCFNFPQLFLFLFFFLTRSRDNLEASKNDLDVWEDLYTRLNELVQFGFTENLKTSQTAKGKTVVASTINNNQLSMIEVMVNLAMKYSSNEIMYKYNHHCSVLSKHMIFMSNR